MYFKENKDTNIDNEFAEINKKKKQDEYKQKMKLVIPITIGVIVLILLIILLITRRRYYLVLEGSEEMTIYQGTTFIEPGYNAYDNKKNTYNDKVTITGEVNSDEIGAYTINYKFRKKTVDRVVNVVEKPAVTTIIHLTGDQNMYISVGGDYFEPGYSAVDAIDGDLTDNVTVNSNVDTSKAGTYQVVYSVVNSSGVTTTKTRIVVVE